MTVGLIVLGAVFVFGLGLVLGVLGCWADYSEGWRDGYRYRDARQRRLGHFVGLDDREQA